MDKDKKAIRSRGHAHAKRAVHHDTNAKSSAADLSTSIYSRSKLTRNIILPITAIGKNIMETIERYIRSTIEGKCTQEGFIRPGSTAIITHSAGQIMHGSYVSFEVVFDCDVCYPVANMLVRSIVKTITKAGIHGESADEVPSPFIAFVPREHHYNSEAFSAVEVGDMITLKVIATRFELNDSTITIMGELKR